MIHVSLGSRAAARGGECGPAEGEGAPAAGDAQVREAGAARLRSAQADCAEAGAGRH